MNEVISALLERRSVRVYEDKAVAPKDLETIVNCGRYAATAMGLQPWHFTVITDRNVLRQISAANRQLILADPNTPPSMRESAGRDDFDSFRGAPAAILVSGVNGEEYTLADCANATENMALAAHGLGLGSCYLGSFKICMNAPGGEKFRKMAGIPDGYIPFFALSVGYAAESPAAAPRKENDVSYVP